MSVSILPSEAYESASSFGCDFNEGRYRVTDAWYEVIGGGKFDPDTALVWEMQPLNRNGDEAGDKGFNRYNAGRINGPGGDAGFYPESEDVDYSPGHQIDEGDKGMFLNGPRSPDKFCKMTCLLRTLVKDKGFKEGHLRSGDARCFVGMAGTLGPKEFKPTGNRNAFTIPVFTEIETYPYESAGGGRRGGSSGRSRRKVAEEPKQESQQQEDQPQPAATSAEVAEVDPDVREAAIDFLESATVKKHDKGATIGKNTVKKDVVALALDDNDLTDQQRAALGALISDEEFLDEVGKQVGFTLLGRKIQID
jgi:hypothetical protein